MYYIQKIEKALKAKNLTAKRMLLDLGYSDNLISQWKKGSEPSAIKLYRISKYLELSMDYLLSENETQESSSPKMSDEELRAIELFRKLPPMEQGRIIGRIETILESTEK